MTAAEKLSRRMRSTITALATQLDCVTASRAQNIDLATAENCLLRSELQELYKAGIQQNISNQSPIVSKTLAYPSNLSGDSGLLAALADLFQAYFNPAIIVQPSHIVATPGATHCLDALLTTICDEGDSVLVPEPYWNGFSLHFQLRPRVTIIPVRPDWTGTSGFTETSDLLRQSLLPALRVAVRKAPDRNRIRALVIANPNNPLGQCYTAEVLQEALDFCKSMNIHYISDEIYALSQLPGKNNFVSALSLDAGGASPIVASPTVEYEETIPEVVEPNHNEHESLTPRKRKLNGSAASELNKRPRANGHPTTPAASVHVIWSTSKDMCSSGLRIAALVSQSPQSSLILKSVSLLSSMHLSSLSSLATMHLLRSPEIPRLITQNSQRLGAAHALAYARFRRWGTPFIAAQAGPFVLVRLGSAQAGEEIMSRLKSAKVMVAYGHSFGTRWYEGDGGFWVRLTVAVPRATLWDGLHRIEFAMGYK